MSVQYRPIADFKSIESQMIKSIQIKNYRCFESIGIDKCKHINLIVGDNASGKTSLLEAIFLALGHNPELGVRFRQHRGLEGTFTGSLRGIEEAIWRDYFYLREWNRTIEIVLNGDGPESRTVRVQRGVDSMLSIPLYDDAEKTAQKSSSISIVWRDYLGNEHASYPKVTKTGIQFESEEEDIPYFFLFPASVTLNSVETAQRFSELSISGKIGNFIKAFTKEYDFIEDLNIEVLGGSPTIYAKIRGQKHKLPLANISGGIHRMITIMLAVASSEKSVVLVDEIENGIYFRHQQAIWRSLLDMTRSMDSQLFLTTHSEEWLESFTEAIGDDVKDVALWRVERTNGNHIVRQFSGKQVIAGIRAGEVR